MASFYIKVLFILMVILYVYYSIVNRNIKINIFIVELLRTVANGTKMLPNGKTTEGVELDSSEVKLIRRNCFR